ncbi:polymorphic toxin-type HINT domain-containing protein [Fodinicola feengrottensis]|uniref:polymorphic toxin-type HINT domain-containing protein n=1 Tax=Fodinicola feengrottensis TaxID=435914 RepID=UPI0013D4358F
MSASAINGHIQTITSTQGHPYWDATRHAFVPAALLVPGDNLLQSDGAVSIVEGVRGYAGHAVTYNLTVASSHTYYVRIGGAPTLVHNCGPSEGLLQEADNAEIAGGDFAAEYTSPSGRTYLANNKSGVEIPDGMADDLESLDHPHLGCAEMQCLAQAYREEGPDAIRGGNMTVVHVSDTEIGDHGALARPCRACARVLFNLFVSVTGA